MSSNGKGRPVGIQSVLICGCGLIGTSLAMAWRHAQLPLQIYGLESLPAHRAQALQTGAFLDIYETPTIATYDLLVLATPVDIACAQLSAMDRQAKWVMDVCSVKQPLTDMAIALGRQQTFAPTHPMAGLAAEGPAQAAPAIFVNRPWLYLEEWSACTVVKPLLVATGAHVVPVASAHEHDAAMAAVSHGVHLASLMTMLMYRELLPEGRTWADFTGPGFRDVTRLCASPSGFWASTLLANRENVLDALAAYGNQLEAFQSALKRGDATSLQCLLDAARAAHTQWRESHNDDSGRY